MWGQFVTDTGAGQHTAIPHEDHTLETKAISQLDDLILESLGIGGIAFKNVYGDRATLFITEQAVNNLEKIKNAVLRKRKPLRSVKEIGMAVGKVINKYKVAKHFKMTITEDFISWQRKAEAIESEARLDGFYIIRTSVEEKELSANETVKVYKGLSLVEQAFRSLKAVDLKIRPIFHHLADRVKAHVFLCMLAYYVEWHMRERLAPILFDDDDKENAQQPSPMKQN